MTVYHLENVSYLKKTWDVVFAELVKHLKNKHSAKVVYDGNTPDIERTLYIPELNYQMKDCELVIYDEHKDSFKAISFSEHKTNIWNAFEKRNNKNDLLLITQFYDWFNKECETGEFKHDLSHCKFSVGSTVFYPLWTNIDYEEIYSRRKAKKPEEFVDKMFMLFGTHRSDPFELSKRGYLNEMVGFLEQPEYFDALINHKVGLSIATVADFCYRDIEYMAIGMPYIRVEYINEFDPPLIPNFHYVSIDREKNGLPHNSGLDREGSEKHVEAYIKRFLEVKEDTAFLEFVANNAREYYVKYCSPKNRIPHLLNLLRIRD